MRLVKIRVKCAGSENHGRRTQAQRELSQTVFTSKPVVMDKAMAHEGDPLSSTNRSGGSKSLYATGRLSEEWANLTWRFNCATDNKRSNFSAHERIGNFMTLSRHP